MTVWNLEIQNSEWPSRKLILCHIDLDGPALRGQQHPRTVHEHVHIGKVVRTQHGGLSIADSFVSGPVVMLDAYLVGKVVGKVNEAYSPSLSLVARGAHSHVDRSGGRSPDEGRDQVAAVKHMQEDS